MKRRSRQSAHAHDQAGMLDLARLVKQLRRYRADLRILQRLDQVLNPIRLLRFDVVVKKKPGAPRLLPRRRGCTCRKN